MAAPIEITYRHFEPDTHIAAKIQDLIGQLDKYDTIMNGLVVVEGAQTHGHKTVAEVRVELNYPGGKAVGKRSGEYPSPSGRHEFDVALTQAFHAAASQIKNHFRKLRPQDDAIPAQASLRGIVRQLNLRDRNGFVELPDGSSLFFAEAVLQGDFDKLHDGDEAVAIKADEDGAYGPQASSVKPLGPLA